MKPRRACRSLQRRRISTLIMSRFARNALARASWGSVALSRRLARPHRPAASSRRTICAPPTPPAPPRSMPAASSSPARSSPATAARCSSSSRRRRTGKSPCSASDGCGICAPPIPRSPAPMRARWSTTGFPIRNRKRPIGRRADVLARRVISLLSQAPLGARRYRRQVLSPLSARPHARNPLSALHHAGHSRRRAAAAGADRAVLRLALPCQPGPPHPHRHAQTVRRIAAADPARRRPHLAQPRRADRTADRPAAAAADLCRAKHRAAAGAARMRSTA